MRRAEASDPSAAPAARTEPCPSAPAGQPLRLHLGCGGTYLEGYVNIDYPRGEHQVMDVKADVHADITRLSYAPGSVDEIRLHHVFEHFNRVTALALLIRWSTWLKPGGRITIETPDLEGSARIVLSDLPYAVKAATARHLAGDQAAHWAYHVDHWFPERFQKTLDRLGFEAISLATSNWSRAPYLANVTVSAVKSSSRELTPAEFLSAADAILAESTVDASETAVLSIWRRQLREQLFPEPSNIVAPDVPIAVSSAAHSPVPVLAMVFSKDRPLQLDAALRSMMLHCQDFDRLRVEVIYRASTPEFLAGYGRLRHALAPYGNIVFTSEVSFRQQVMQALGAAEHVLWVVDDNLFVRRFRLQECLEALHANQDAVGYSLRLGRNTTYCYPFDRPQRLPSFEPISEFTRRFLWTTAELDFGYPLEVSSSLYRTRDLLPVLDRIDFSNPNALEGELAKQTDPMRLSMPYLLCPECSVAFCNPANKVQSVAPDNRTGHDAALAPESLLRAFMNGKILDIFEFIDFTPGACHQEVALPLCEPASAAPEISVVITCFNYARYLPEAVASVVRQTFEDFEIVIVNDGSTDDTQAVATALIADNPQRRIRLIDQQNSGQPAIARNNGIRASRGRLILCLDADDTLAPFMLEACWRLLATNPEVAIAYTDRLDFGEAEGVVQAGEYDFARLKHANHLSYCALYRREVWERIGGYRENVKGLEDWDFWIAAGARGHYGKRIALPLFRYRRHGASLYQQVLQDFDRKKAQVLINNAELYDPQTIAQARRALEPLRTTAPMVSVIVPTFNRPRQLREALQSILEQTWQDFEIIVVNDAGEDVASLLRAFESSKISYLSHAANKGLAAARNTGIRAARGKYLAYLDDDDIFYPDHLETLVRHCEATGVPVAYTDAYRAFLRHTPSGPRITHRDLPYRFDFDRRRLLITNYIPVLCFLQAREAVVDQGLFDESLTSHEDWDLWVRLSRTHRFEHVARVTSEFRWCSDGSTMTSAKRADYLRTARCVYDKIRKAENPDTDVIQQQEASLFSRRCELHAFRPKVLCSIIVPLHNQVAYTRRCVQTLLANTPLKLFELVFVDNASSDGTAQFLESIAHPKRIVSNTRNEGFTIACNQGAALASGKYLVFLNNDTEPQAGWLEALASMAEKDMTVGAVGSKLIYPNGVLQEAGAMILPDGANRCVGNGDSPDKPQYNACYEVDYCSAASLLVRADLFKELGGFDQRYAPAYYEDPDLCLGLRKLGYSVLYNHRSVVIHHESVTAGQDPTSGMKRHYWINRQKLVDKWQDYLENKPKSHRIYAPFGSLPAPQSRPARLAQPKGLQPAGPEIAAAPGTIVVDGVIFQLQRNRPYGISRFWSSLLEELSKGPLAGQLLLLDRGASAPDIPGIRKRAIGPFAPGTAEQESQALASICRETNASLFLSTYYTYPAQTRSLLVLYDMIPERFHRAGEGAADPEWRDKHHAIQHSTAFAAISSSTANDLAAFYPQSAPRFHSVIHCAAAPAFRMRQLGDIAACKAKLGIVRPYFLLVGRQDDYKNADTFLEAFARLPGRERFGLVVSGVNEAFAARARRTVPGLEIVDRFFSDETLCHLYCGALCLVYISLCEGFGLPILEAMRAGCPVITCRNSSIPEVAGDAALYVSERDPKQLAEGLQNVQNPSVRLAMIKQGLEQAKRFAWDRSAVLLERAIREVASQPPGQQPPVGKSVLRDPTVPPEWEAAQVSRPVAA